MFEKKFSRNNVISSTVCFQNLICINYSKQRSVFICWFLTHCPLWKGTYSLRIIELHTKLKMFILVLFFYLVNLVNAWYRIDGRLIKNYFYNCNFNLGDFNKYSTLVATHFLISDESPPIAIGAALLVASIVWVLNCSFDGKGGRISLIGSFCLFN